MMKKEPAVKTKIGVWWQNLRLELVENTIQHHLLQEGVVVFRIEKQILEVEVVVWLWRKVLELGVEWVYRLVQRVAVVKGVQIAVVVVVVVVAVVVAVVIL